MEPIYVILIISFLGPIIGSLIGIIKKPSNKFMFNMLAFAAGVMLAISFIDLIPESIKLSSVWITAIGILLGALVMYTLDRLIPHIHPGLCKQEQGRNLERTSVYLFLGILLHNFPEGMAIGIGAVSGIKISMTIALAIAIHNIPEGIVTSAPYYYITKKRLKSFLISSSTAIPIVVGFLFANFLFKNIPSNTVGLIIAATAGLMIYISGDELIPTSCNKASGEWSHATIFSLILGVIFVILLGAI
jgi:zinc transporter, ZIP family